MKIIEFDPKYTQEIYDFVMSIKRDEIGWKSSADDLFEIPEKYLKDGGGFWTAIDEGKVVGTLALKNMGDSKGYLKRMFLAKEYRGTGLAQQMFGLLINQAKLQNLKEIYLATTSGPIIDRAVAFYEKSGFEQVESLPKGFAHDDDDIFMKLEIK